MTDITYDKEKVNKRIDKVKLQLMSEDNTAFFSALLANLKIIIVEGYGRAGTNAVYIKFDPVYLLTLTLEELLFVLVHEVLHVAFDHIITPHEAGLDPELHNIAADHYINLYLKSLGYAVMDDCYCDPQYTGKSTMEIYHLLLKNPPPPPPGGGVFVPDVIQDLDGMSPEEIKEIVIANILKAVTQADMSNQPGSVPGEVRRGIKEIVSPKLPWNLILQNYMSSYAKDDYTWARPNKRFQPEFYMPSMRSEKIGQITFGDDVSGSMSNEDLCEIHSEQIYIKDLLHPERVRLMTFDTVVHLNKTYEEGENMDDIVLEGGGGTIVQPLLDSIREEEPLFAIIFTDGYFSTPNMDNIHSDIFWIIKGNPGFTAPKGIIIDFDQKGK